ncbi:Cell division protein ZapA [Dethiosulfatibacter aminovorans DSM 17477]|uniref:Cell division protein ZapA n=1 Tax=Dethiosulfatibacter aminovorans DSM 17477 TaxID=1121476 RepID=A0A1M6GYZ3_9FIRM|nr:cell division protein ZapA [Dethiosulfatibacter aminovorans]SHJ15124.1 Cell division protein ZapA [Dethiosulfatibacter aminovorans DSM 17477]
MQGYNSVEIKIAGKKYKVQTNENQEYIKKIEEMINSKIQQFKSTDKKFDSFSSLAFTTFIISDKYFKILDQLEKAKQIEKSAINPVEIKKLKEEKSNLVIDLERSTEEKDKLLQELIQKNSEFDILANKLTEYENMLKEKDEELAFMNEMNKELDDKFKKLSEDLFMIREESEETREIQMPLILEEVESSERKDIADSLLSQNESGRYVPDVSKLLDSLDIKEE